MKNFLKINTIIAACAMLATASTAYASPTASFSISSSGAHVVGTPFTVMVSENSGAQEVNAVEANIKYDASKLQVVSVSAGEFTTCIPAPSASSQIISFSCTALGSKFVNSHNVGTITFKPLTSGTTSVNILSTSAIVDANTASQNDWNGVQTTASYNLTAPVVAQPGQSTPKPSTPAKGTTGTPAKTNQPGSPSSTPVVAGVSVTGTPVATPENVATTDESESNDSDTLAAGSESKSNPVGLWIVGGILALAAIGGGVYYWMKRSRKSVVKA